MYDYLPLTKAQDSSNEGQRLRFDLRSNQCSQGNSNALAHQKGPSNIPPQVSAYSTDMIGTECTHDWWNDYYSLTRNDSYKTMQTHVSELVNYVTDVNLYKTRNGTTAYWADSS